MRTSNVHAALLRQGNDLSRPSGNLNPPSKSLGCAQRRLGLARRRRLVGDARCPDTTGAGAISRIISPIGRSTDVSVPRKCVNEGGRLVLSVTDIVDRVSDLVCIGGGLNGRGTVGRGLII